MIQLRTATLEDVPTLDRWDREPHVIAATSDDPDAAKAFGDTDWPDELALQSDHYRYFIAELDGRPIGAMQIIDAHREETGYWGDVEPGVMAIDIWIGDAADLGHGHGAHMMAWAIDRCFSDPEVTAIMIDPLASNTRAHRFYQRLGFVPVGERLFHDEDLCLVHRLDRAHWRGPTSPQGD